MKISNVHPVKEALAAALGASLSLLLAMLVDSRKLPPGVDLLHGIVAASSFLLLAFCFLRKRQQRRVSDLIWLATVASVGWLGGLWIESRLL